MKGREVGYVLYREVRDFAPGDWDPAMMVVALIIADDASEKTRRSLILPPLLHARTRLKPTAIRAALARLGNAGYEFRVSFGEGRDGRPVYAARNHFPEYSVPLLTDIRAAQAGLSLPDYVPP